MVIQAPPPPSAEPAVEDGVIEDARRRQQRHRRIAALLVSAVAGALLAGLAAGGSGGAGGGAGAKLSNSGPGPQTAHLSATSEFPGAPVTQPNEGVYINACPLATPNRYLPARAGCVTVRHVDMTGDGRPDLVIVYSVLSRRHPYWYNGGAPPSIAKDFKPLRAYLKVVLPDGVSASIRIGPEDGARAALIDAAARVNDDRGGELFLLVGRSSSGATDAAYGLHDGRLIDAGVPLSYGGDSGAKQGYDCAPGNPPRLVQRTYALIGGSIYGLWQETRSVYAWHGPRLVRVSTRTVNRRGDVTKAETVIGPGCTRGIE